MDWDVIHVQALPDYKLYVELKNRRVGIFDVAPYLAHGVFKELKDPRYFAQVGIQYGAITWPHDQDIAPETLVAELQAYQRPQETSATPITAVTHCHHNDSDDSTD
jgi:hypothetical protein